MGDARLALRLRAFTQVQGFGRCSSGMSSGGEAPLTWPPHRVQMISGSTIQLKAPGNLLLMLSSRNLFRSCRDQEAFSNSAIVARVMAMEVRSTGPVSPLFLGPTTNTRRPPSSRKGSPAFGAE